MFEHVVPTYGGDTGSDIIRSALETQSDLLMIVIRRFDYARDSMPLQSSRVEWRGLARRAFDDAVEDLSRQLDRTRHVLDRAYADTIRALDDLAGRVR